MSQPKLLPTVAQLADLKIRQGHLRHRDARPAWTGRGDPDTIFASLDLASLYERPECSTSRVSVDRWRC
ncbi:unnamed protein product, partial [Iphiclides podalirius]